MTDLHAAIMNLEPPSGIPLDYQLGFNAARHAAAELVSAALAQPEPAAPAVVDPLKGWKLNHVQFVRGSGKAEIGYLDPEDDRFAPIVTVDTGLYYEPNQAHPLAVAILGALQDAPPPRAALTDEQIDSMWRVSYRERSREPETSFDWFEAGIRAAEAAHGIGGPRNE